MRAGSLALTLLLLPQLAAAQPTTPPPAAGPAGQPAGDAAGGSGEAWWDALPGGSPPVAQPPPSAPFPPPLESSGSAAPPGPTGYPRPLGVGQGPPAPPGPPPTTFPPPLGAPELRAPPAGLVGSEHHLGTPLAVETMGGRAPTTGGGNPPWQRSVPAQEPLPELEVVASLHASSGRLRGLARTSHDAGGLGWGGMVGLRVLQQLVFYVDLDRPPLASADPNPSPLTDSSSMQIYGGGVRAYLNPHGWVQPFFGLGAARFEMESVYRMKQSSAFGSVSARVAGASLSGSAWRMGLGADVRLVRVPVGDRRLTVVATGAAEYLLASWDEMYCFDDETTAATGGALGGCLYEGDQGAFQDSDLLLLRLGVGVQY